MQNVFSIWRYQVSLFIIAVQLGGMELHIKTGRNTEYLIYMYTIYIQLYVI